MKKKDKISDITQIKGICDAIGDGISIMDPDYIVLYQNKVHKDMIGDHIGEHCYKAFEQNENICVDCPLTLSFKDGAAHTAERSASLDKGTVYVEITASPLKDLNGEIVGGIEVVRDITRRKQTELKLVASEKQYKDLVDNALVGIYKTNISGNILYINRALADMFEFESVEQMMQVNVQSLYGNPKDRDLLIDNLNSAGKVQSFCFEAITKKKNKKMLLLSAVLDGDQLSGMIMDITELIKTEEKLINKMEELIRYYEISGRMYKIEEIKEDIKNLRVTLLKYKK